MLIGDLWKSNWGIMPVIMHFKKNRMKFLAPDGPRLSSGDEEVEISIAMSAGYAMLKHLVPLIKLVYESTKKILSFDFKER